MDSSRSCSVGSRSPSLRTLLILRYTSLRRFITVETMYEVSDRSSFMLASEVERRLDTCLNLCWLHGSSVFQLRDAI